MIIESRVLLMEIADKLKEHNTKIVTTNGCFDILHAGHLHFLRESRKYGDVLIVGVNCDERVMQLKGKDRPRTPLSYRMLALDLLDTVLIVHPFTEDDPSVFLETVRPDVHAKGGDYFNENMPERAVVEQHGGKVKLVPFKYDISTTHILEGDMI